MVEGERRGPGRPRREDMPVREREERAEEVRRERRRATAPELTARRLGVNASMLDFGRYVYRWLNDDPARIFTMTRQDDWDIVKTDGGLVKDDNSDLGDAVSVVVGRNPDGSAKRAYLARKPRSFYDADQEEKQKELDEQLRQLRLGNTARGQSQGDYVPPNAIRIA